ncbi:hypothetical protein GCM10027088_04050 [Nocardia goodfellowii]
MRGIARGDAEIHLGPAAGQVEMLRPQHRGDVGREATQCRVAGGEPIADDRGRRRGYPHFVVQRPAGGVGVHPFRRSRTDPGGFGDLVVGALQRHPAAARTHQPRAQDRHRQLRATEPAEHHT